MALKNFEVFLFLPVIFFHQLTAKPYDATLIQGSRGKEVADAVLRHISNSSIFPEDHSFLSRLAYVESKFGMDPNTYTPDYHGGLWQVDEPVFISTQRNQPELVRMREQIQQKFGIEWNKAEWKNLEIPLYSGLAAALYFTSVSTGRQMPDTIVKQADIWKKYYRPAEDVRRFVNESRELREKTMCRGKMDLCIVLDSSGSINERDTNNYNRAKEFAAELIESFTLDYNRIGMLVYSSNTSTNPDVVDVFPMKNSFTISQMAKLARSAPYLNAQTRTDLGIHRAVEMFNELDRTEGIPRLLFVFTDGNSNAGSDMQGAVHAIRISDLIPVSVGIGNGINRAELELIALNNQKRVFMVGDFVALQDFLYQITTIVCETPQSVPGEAKVKDSIIKDEKRLYEVKLPPQGVTVTMDVKKGNVKGYWSYTDPVPSAAIHDGKIDNKTFYIPPPKNYFRVKRDVSTSETINPPASTVHISVQGVEEKNNYTLTVAHGNVAPQNVGNSLAGIQTLCFFTAIFTTNYRRFI